MALECVSSFCNVVLAGIVENVIFAWIGFALNMAFSVKRGFFRRRMTFGFERNRGRGSILFNIFLSERVDFNFSVFKES